MLCTHSPRALVNSSGFKCEEGCTIGRQSPENTAILGRLGRFFCLFLVDGRGVSVDKNHLLSCLDLGRDSVIPSPWSVRRAGGKEQRRGGGIDFQREGMWRIELRCVAETGFERSVLLAGETNACSLQHRAVQFELEQVPVMLINCIAVFHHPLPASSSSPCPGLNSSWRPLDKQVVLKRHFNRPCPFRCAEINA